MALKRCTTLKEIECEQADFKIGKKVSEKIMLDFKLKRKVFSSFPMYEYTTHNGDRTNFKYKHKVIVSGLMHTGNAYIWGRDIATYSNKYKIDPRGWINVKEFSEEELRKLLDKVISYRDKLPLRSIEKQLETF